jgi:hypothetical protein
MAWQRQRVSGDQKGEGLGLDQEVSWDQTQDGTIMRYTAVHYRMFRELYGMPLRHASAILPPIRGTLVLSSSVDCGVGVLSNRMCLLRTRRIAVSLVVTRARCWCQRAGASAG